MSKDLLKIVEATQLRSDPLPDFEAGDTVSVHLRVTEGGQGAHSGFSGCGHCNPWIWNE